MSDSQFFMQTIPHYEVHWEADPRFDANVPTASLTVAQDDLQAVLRSVVRTYPGAKIDLRRSTPIGNQIAVDSMPLPLASSGNSESGNLQEEREEGPR